MQQPPLLCVVYLVPGSRAFSRGFRIIWSIIDSMSLATAGGRPSHPSLIPRPVPGLTGLSKVSPEVCHCKWSLNEFHSPSEMGTKMEGLKLVEGPSPMKNFKIRVTQIIYLGPLPTALSQLWPRQVGKCFVVRLFFSSIEIPFYPCTWNATKKIQGIELLEFAQVWLEFVKQSISQAFKSKD